MRARIPVLVLLAACSAPGFADELGRLFFTPEQRALLELARRTQGSGAPADADGAGGVTLSGIVTRSDGRQTLWVNGRAQPAGTARDRSPSAATLPLPGGTGQVRLRVGQTLDPETGRIEEGWRRPRPTAQTSRPAANAPAPAARAAEPRDDAPESDAAER